MANDSPSLVVKLNRDAAESLLADFLKGDSRVGKDRVIQALSACYQSLALSRSNPEDRAAIELSAIESLMKLRSQMLYVLNYHRLMDGIEFPPDLLISLGMVGDSSLTSHPSTTVSAPVAASGGEFNYDFSALDN